MNMPLLRYFQRQKIMLHCETVTPMFLGNAQQRAEWRSAPFKGLLRYWWRVTQHQKQDHDALLREESRLFGSAGDFKDIETCKSLIQVMVSSQRSASQNDLPTPKNIEHPECIKQNKSINPLLYLAGMGIIEKGKLKRERDYFPEKSDFDLLIEYPKEDSEDINKVFALLSAFGAIGSRCRNGWGSFQFKNEIMDKEEAVRLLNKCTRPWKEGFTNEYPNCLGGDDKGLLLWKTKAMPSWSEGMRELAQAYAWVRAKEIGGINKIDPGGNDEPGERHLLGVPLTHHNPRKWGPSARHGSPLRFVVRCRQEKYTGFALHLPHEHSKQQIEPKKINQIKVWQKVHEKLDNLLARANYEECL